MLHCSITGGRGPGDNIEGRTDVLIYDGNQNKWSKVGDLCHARFAHAMSFVSGDIVDDCIIDIDC